MENDKKYNSPAEFAIELLNRLKPVISEKIEQINTDLNKNEEKPTSHLVPVIHGPGDSFGGKEFHVEHLDGSKKIFYADEGEHESVKKQAEDYRKRNLSKNKKINKAEDLLSSLNEDLNKGEKDKFESCVMDVKAKQGEHDKVNPFAVCHASVDKNEKVLKLKDFLNKRQERKFLKNKAQDMNKTEEEKKLHDFKVGDLVRMTPEHVKSVNEDTEHKNNNKEYNNNVKAIDERLGTVHSLPNTSHLSLHFQVNGKKTPLTVHHSNVKMSKLSNFKFDKSEDMNEVNK